jgi:hypothetical protein
MTISINTEPISPTTNPLTLKKTGLLRVLTGVVRRNAPNKSVKRNLNKSKNRN